ncbi:vq motif-containing protein 25 [Abeliophyllum distichum]|uniref:Vq motif-containing protein 25 n=1 Tax=Abeliophyllum distichum TaxID=126358 RepID=A0ABD1VCP9_9LAMI
MEGMLQKQTGVINKAPSAALGMHKNSQKISKIKPKIRIIHIFAPEIIKTDAANFRELVQRLTGKPTENIRSCTKKNSPRNVQDPRILAKKMEVAMKTGFQGSGFKERIKGEEEIWRNANTGAGFLGGFSEFDGFMQEINQFPLVLPFEGSSQIDQLENGVI